MANSKGITAEIRAKAQETVRLKALERQASAVKFGDRVIRRVDDLNWGIDEKGKDLKYYATFEQACESMLHMKIEDSVKKDVQNILSAIQQAKTEVVQALGKFCVSA